MLPLVKKFTKLGIDTLICLRIKRSQICYHLFPNFFFTNKRLERREKTIAAVTILSIILTFVVTIIFFKFYVFEADIRLIYLDTIEDASYANTKPSSHDDWGNRMVLLTGWNYYNKFTDFNHTLRTANTIERTNDGYWITRKSNENENQFHLKEKNKIRLSNFQFLFSHEVRLALRFYIRGYARIYVTFEHSYSTDTHNLVIFHESEDSNSEQSEFCTLIIEPPFGCHVKTIDIAAVAYNEKSFVALDKVVAAVGNDKRSLHMLYTLLSQGWCSSAIKVHGTEFKTN